MAQRYTDVERRQLYSEFIWWILDQLLCSLLRTRFYMMSAGKFGTGTIFFRHDILKEAPWVNVTEKYELCPVKYKGYLDLTKYKDLENLNCGINNYN